MLRLVLDANAMVTPATALPAPERIDEHVSASVNISQMDRIAKNVYHFTTMHRGDEQRLRMCTNAKVSSN